MRIAWGYGYIDLSETPTKGIVTMAYRQQYKKDGVAYALVKNEALDNVTPYWVYVNHKLASKFASKDVAKQYLLVLMR